MADRLQDFEEIAGYPIDPEARNALLASHRECAVVWSNREGWPVGVMHLYFWRDERFWVTCTERRKRVAALRARPQSSVIVAFADERTVTAKTWATVHPSDSEAAKWFLPALAEQVLPGQPDSIREVGVDGFVARLESEGRVIIELEPRDWISFDGRKVKAHGEGRWAPGEPWAEHD